MLPCAAPSIAGGNRAVRDLLVFLVWNCAVFGGGFAAGWAACRRRLRRKAKLGRTRP
jgi:hypothetical protein